MLKDRFHSQAFAIRFKQNKGKFDKGVFHALMKQVSGDFPQVRIEGITEPKRKNVIASVGNFQFTNNKRNHNKELVCIGVDDVFDVSFQKEKDIIVGGFYATVPVLDITKDREEIVRRLKEYLRVAYPVTYTQKQCEERCERKVIVEVVEAKQPKVTFHSTFVQVGDQIISWAEWYRMERAVNTNTRVKAKRVQVVEEKQEPLRNVVTLLKGQF